MKNENVSSATYRNYTLGVLTLVFAINIIDRQILAILIEPIKHELRLSDTQLGFLSGLAFAIFYGVCAMPLAMWADRGNRRNIIALTLAIFSGMTVVCGLAKNFIQLLIARIGVAIGEAGGTPPSHSMIADMFPAEKRATALGTYSLGLNIGTLIGFLVGGWINQWYGWRTAFFVVGVPGLLIAILLRFTVREPMRGHADGLVSEGEGALPTLSEVLRFLWAQRSFRHIACACILITAGGTAFLNWLPAFFSRSFGMASGETGTALALALGLLGGIGTYFSGYVADRLGKQDIRWYLWSVAIAYMISVPFWAAVFLSSTKAMALIFFLYPAFAMGAWMGGTLAMTQALVPVRMRTRASATLYLLLSLLGGSIGPQLTGILSDIYSTYSGQQSLRYALLTMCVAFFWASIHYVIATRTLKGDIERTATYAPVAAVPAH